MERFGLTVCATVVEEDVGEVCCCCCCCCCCFLGEAVGNFNCVLVAFASAGAVEVVVGCHFSFRVASGRADSEFLGWVPF